MNKRISIEVLLFICVAALPAQNKRKADFRVQGDIVSSYIWRGMYQSGAAVQPALEISAGGFSLTAWGSVDFNGNGKKEADMTAAYSVAGLTISLTDYWWAGQTGCYAGNNPAEATDSKNAYFNFDNHTTDHILEAGLSYSLPFGKFPLNLSWYTMLWGGDKKANDKGKRQNAYSSYAELNYPFTVKNIRLNAMVGISPFYSPANYKNDSFAVVNVSLKAVKEIGFTDRFSLPVFTQLIWNPDREDVHFVFGITFK